MDTKIRIKPTQNNYSYPHPLIFRFILVGNKRAELLNE